MEDVNISYSKLPVLGNASTRLKYIAENATVTVPLWSKLCHYFFTSVHFIVPFFPQLFKFHHLPGFWRVYSPSWFMSIHLAVACQAAKAELDTS